MRKTKVALNGFGRIGRAALKIILARPDLEIIAVNDLADGKILSHLFKYDTVYGTYQRDVNFDNDQLIIDEQKIKFFHEPKPATINWGELGVEVVIDCTGRFLTTELAQQHLDAGAQKVVLSAPAKDDKIKTIVLGVNESDLANEDKIISNASCTTNCTAPVLAILENAIGISKSLMTTVHAMTVSQPSVDSPARDPRMSRSANQNIIPTTTGASKAVVKVMPEIKGKLEAMSIRVPVPTVSLCDFAIVLDKKTTLDEIKKTFKQAVKSNYYQGIVDVTEEELVSSDMIGNPASAIIDLNLTNLVDGDLLKVVAWYDNEWGYANRLVELTADFGAKND